MGNEDQRAKEGRKKRKKERKQPEQSNSADLAEKVCITIGNNSVFNARKIAFLPENP